MFIFWLGVLYFLIALYFIGWVIAVRQRLPDYVKGQVTFSLLGLFKKMTLALDTRFSEITGMPLPSQVQQQTPASGAANNGKPQKAAAQGGGKPAGNKS